MVSVVWLILSLLGVCAFSWWPVLIEAFLLMLLVSFASQGRGGQIVGGLVAGVVPFAAFRLFCGLTLSPWWLLAAPFWNLLALLVPGGYTVSALLLKRYGFMTLPTWMLVILILIDILSLTTIIMGIVESRREKKGTAGR